MAITYDGTGGVFTEIGKIVGCADNIEKHAEGFADPMVTEIATSFDNATVTHMEGLKAIRDAYYAQANERRKSLYALASSRVRDPVRIVAELHLPSASDLKPILARFREQMVTDAKTVKKCTVTLGSVTPGAGNSGNGTMFVSKVLDGYSKPGDFFDADRNYNGLDSELCADSETITVECTGDSQTSTLSEGQETFKVYGHPANPSDSTPTPYFGVGDQGSGSSLDKALYGPHRGTLVTDPGFESWSSAAPPAPNAWTLDAGVLGTHVAQQTAGANIYRGSFGIKFVGDAATAPAISQAMTVGNLKPLRRYLVSLRYKASGAVAVGTLECLFTGTGYTAGGTEKISIAAGSLATSWTLATFQINLPAVIPTDFKLVLRINGNLSAGVSIYFDDLYLQPMTYFGGVAMAVVPGSTRFCVGDRFAFTVANDRVGKFQSFWARNWGRQLPSAALPAISELLCNSTSGVGAL